MNGARAEYDAVIVGAGPNGLSAAVTLARAGLRVAVFEANDSIGGGARSAELTLPGFTHDVCSAIHPLAAGSPFFRQLPLHEHGLEWVHPDLPLAHPLDDGSAVVLERSIEVTAASIGDAASSDGRAWDRLLRPFVEHWDELARELLAPPLHLPRNPVLMARFGWSAMQPAAGLARRRFRGERARALFAGLGAHSVLPLERRPSAAFALVLAASGHAVGWPFPRGGSQRITDALAALLRSNGGEIFTGRRIGSLGELPESRAVLFDVAPRILAAIAGDALPERYRARLQQFRHGPGAFKIDWALRGPIPWVAEACRRAGTIHAGGTLEEIAAAEGAVWQGEHPERPFVLVAQQSMFDPSRAPAGGGMHAGWGYCHVPHGSTRDMTGAIESQIERFAPGFRATILARHTRDCAQLEADNANCIGGDISGGVGDLAQLLRRPVLSPCPYATPNPRLFLCSASTPPGGGVHGMCGHNAARAALRRAFRTKGPPR